MRYPDHSMTGSGGVRISTILQEDGNWRAEVPLKGVDPVVKPTEVEAIREAKQIVERVLKTRGQY